LPFDVVPEPGETIVLHEGFQPSKKAEPFAFAVSNQALFLPAKKLFAVSDPYYFRRVPLREVQSVALQRTRPAGIWVLSALMIVAGLATTYWMLEPVFSGRGGRVSGYSIGIGVVGVVLPFAARGRFALVVSLTSGSFKWKPVLTVGGPGKAQGLALQQRILEACRKVGLVVRDTSVVA
jgi:hypothetical protein